MGTTSSRMFDNPIAEDMSDVSVSRAILSATPVWVPAIGLYWAIHLIHKPLGEAILRCLGFYPDTPPEVPEIAEFEEDEELEGLEEQSDQVKELLKRLALVGQYYANMEGAIGLVQKVNQQGINPEDTDQAVELIKQIEQQTYDNFKEYDLDELQEIPEQFICPISLTIMLDPVEVITELKQTDKSTSKESLVTFCHIFERKTIAEWVERNNEINPLNKLPIVGFKEASDLKKEIITFIETHAILKEERPSFTNR